MQEAARANLVSLAAAAFFGIFFQPFNDDHRRRTTDFATEFQKYSHKLKNSRKLLNSYPCHRISHKKGDQK